MYSKGVTIARPLLCDCSTLAAAGSLKFYEYGSFEDGCQGGVVKVGMGRVNAREIKEYGCESVCFEDDQRITQPPTPS